MLKCQNITLRRGSKTLLENSSCLIHSGEKVGIVGKNGAGKSSLFALLRGELESETGEISLAKQINWAQIRQEIPSGKQAIIDYVLSGDQQLAELKKQLWQAEQENDGMLIAELYQRYAELDGYTAESRAAKLLVGLGFQQQALQQAIDDFSGGWRMRLNLAQLLMSPADLYLLDEPTNHLDLEAIIWLEQWLKDLPQTILIISHDREFLDNTVKRIIHIDQLQLNSYTGNYSNFEKQLAEQLVLQAKTFEKQQQKISHLQSYVDRFRAKASKAKQAQSRLKMIERMDKVAPVHLASPFTFTFKAAPDATNPMLTLDNVDIGYDENIILSQVNLSLYQNDRIALLGPNGAGKSTLVKALAKKIAVQGNIVQSNKLRIGYFTQHQIEQLSLDECALWHVQKLDNKLAEKDIRTFLGSFNFQGDRVFEPVQNFSGGEKARLALALLVWQQPNLLLLDEPSNHLDLEMREALARALQTYDGALVLISHDRYLIKNIVDDLYLVANGSVQRFDDDLDMYEKWFLEKNSYSEPAPKKVKTKTVANNDDKKLEKFEKQLEEMLAKKKQLEQAIAEAYELNVDNIESLLLQLNDLDAVIVNIEEAILKLLEK